LVENVQHKIGAVTAASDVEIIGGRDEIYVFAYYFFQFCLLTDSRVCFFLLVQSSFLSQQDIQLYICNVRFKPATERAEFFLESL
jgi:hypothetical protein